MYKIQTPDGKFVDMPMMTGSMFSEMADNVAPLMDYRIINRAMGRTFKPYDVESEVVKPFTKNVQDAVQYGKFKLNEVIGKDNVSVVNPYEKGVISVKIRKRYDD